MPDPDPVLPDRSSDDSDRGWGEDVASGDTDSDAAREAWLRRERPPHHDA